MISSRNFTTIIIIGGIISNLFASLSVIVLTNINNAQREASSQRASQEREEMRCILLMEPSTRTSESIKQCRDE